MRGNSGSAKRIKGTVEGKIIAKLSENQAKINLGSADGLKKGMFVVVTHPVINNDGNRYGLAIIEMIDDYAATIEGIQQQTFQDGFEVGWKISSRIEERHRGVWASGFPTFRLR